MIEITYGKETHILNYEKIRVNQVLKELKLNREEVIVIKNGTVVTEDEWLEKGDKIEIIRVISGG